MHSGPEAVRRATERLVWGITLAAVFFMAARPSIGPDTWWHLRTGQWMWQHHAWPWRDPFSYTRYGQPWNPPGPPVQWAMYGLYRLGGPWALDLATAVLVTLALAWIWPLARPRAEAHPFWQAWAVLWAALTSAVYWAARPYLVTFGLAAYFLWVLETYRRGQAGPRRLLSLLPLMTLWANAHGAFIVGLLLWAAYALPALVRAGRVGDGAAARRWLLLGAGLFMAAMLNPAGPARWLYPFQTVRIGVLRAYIAEWQPPALDVPALWPFWAWWPGLILALAVSTRRLPAEHGLLWLGFGLLAWSAVRHVALFALAAALVWGSVAPVAWAELRIAILGRKGGAAKRGLLAGQRAHPYLNALLVALLFGAGLARSWWPYATGQWQRDLRRQYPVLAVAYLRARAPWPGRLFNSYNWGGYLLWHWPEEPVFVDGRTDLYGDAILQQYLTVMRAEPGWQQVLQTWDVAVVLVEPTAPIAQVLPRVGWQVVYADDHAVALVRLADRRP